MSETFAFGLLDKPTLPVPFSFGEVRPLSSNIANLVARWGKEHGHADGWVYPTTLPWEQAVETSDGAEVEQTWPRGEPKPTLWHLEPTHQLIWTHRDHGDGQRYLPAIVMNALGWAFGNRLQFDDWRVDGRVRWRCSPSFIVPTGKVGELLTHVVETALALKGKQLELLTALALHNRVPVYTWDWERHHWQYVALDACWRLLQYRNLVPSRNVPGHAQRIATVCTSLGIPRLVTAERRIVEQRNELVHQGLWCQGMPGYEGTDDAHFDYFRLRRLVDRVLLHVFDIDCQLRTRSWDVQSTMTESLGFPARKDRNP